MSDENDKGAALVREFNEWTPPAPAERPGDENKVAAVVQNYMALHLAIKDGEIEGTGPASYAIARALIARASPAPNDKKLANAIALAVCLPTFLERKMAVRKIIDARASPDARIRAEAFEEAARLASELAGNEHDIWEIPDAIRALSHTRS